MIYNFSCIYFVSLLRIELPVVVMYTATPLGMDTLERPKRQSFMEDTLDERS
jgi:hypothetical protein